MPTDQLLSLDDLSDSAARNDLPKYLTDIRQVHEDYRDNGTPMPDYRSHMYCDFATKTQEQQFKDLLAKYSDHPRMAAIYDLLRRYSRKYQITIPGLVTRFNAQAGCKIKKNSFRRGVSELRKLGLVEIVPLTSSAKHGGTKMGSIIRIKRRDQWPKPFNPDGPTLAELEAQPGYSKQKGRIEPSVKLGEYGRRGRNADAFIFDVYTGEVIERATGAILHVFDWKVRNKWKAFKFVRQFITQEGSKRRGPTHPIILKDIEISNNEITPFPFQGREPRFPASFSSSPISTDPVVGEAGLQEQYLQCVLDEDELADPVTSQNSRYQHALAQDMFERTSIPEGEDEWEVSGRYDPSHNGSLNLGNHEIFDGPEAYLTSKQYTPTDVSRWLHNSHEGTLLRRAVHYEKLEPEEQIRFGKIWMRRFVNARRKDAQYQALRVSGARVKSGDVYYNGLMRRLRQMVVLNYARDWVYQCDKPYTLAHVDDFKHTYRIGVTDVRWMMVHDLEDAIQQRELARQTKLDALGVEGLKAELNCRADEIGQRLLSGDFEAWTLCFKEEEENRVSWKVADQERWIVTMWAALKFNDQIAKTPHADKALAYIGDLAECVSKSWKLAAISNTSMGDALMAHFALFEEANSTHPQLLAVFRARFADFFELYPAEILFDAACMDRALNIAVVERNPNIELNWLTKRRTDIVLDTARRANGLPDYSRINIYNLRVTPCHALSMN